MTDPVAIKIAVPNGLLFVRDSQVRKYPDFDDEKASFWSISTCVMIACLVDCDGATSITIGGAPHGSQSGRHAFDQTLDTPSRTVIVEIVPGETVHEVNVPSEKTRIRIWTDGRHRCAETVVIGLG
jgi:hypothetical protein